MAADALAPCVARASAAMILIMWDTQVLVIYDESFQGPVPLQYREMIENSNLFTYFLKTIQLNKG